MAVFGDTLRQARAHKGVTIREAEVATRINRHHLAALEEEKFDGLPPLIYQRGIVKNYANYLELDPNRLLQLFEDARGVQPDDPPTVASLQPLEMPNHFAPNFAIIAFMVFVSAIVFAWLYSAYFAETPATSTPTEFIATVTPVKNDAFFIPSPTPRPATATATAEPTEEPTVEPTDEPAPTPEEDPAIVETADEEESGDAEEPEDAEALDDVVDEVEAEPTALPENVASIKITALVDLTIDVVADGVSVYSGFLPEGSETEWFTGAEFIVFTSDGVNTQFTNDRDEVFLMTYDSGEATLELFAGG